ncbi:MAG: RNA 2',3'-cyclic phosphodiesterase [Haloarculaceae archaeon]
MGKRLFVSVDLDGLADAVERVQEPLVGLPGVDTVAPEGAHVTLKFLGDVGEARLPGVTDAIAEAVGSADVGPFEATFEGYGVFPSLDYISVVWVGVDEGDTELARLHESIERETTAIGFAPEEHDFTPHATVARVRDARSKSEVQALVREENPTLGRLHVEEVRLTESTLTDDGPVYETVRSFPTRGGDEPPSTPGD